MSTFIIRQGTTPSPRFYMDGDYTDYSLYLTFSVSGMDILVLPGNRLTVSYDPVEKKTWVECKLTQQETLAFPAGREVEIQLRMITDNGNTARATGTIKAIVGKILQQEVLNG